MKKTFTILLIFFFSYSSFCQDTFLKGSIFQLNGDTLKGYVSNSFDSKNITFRKKENGKSEYFSPSKIRGFTIEDKTYSSKYVHINHYGYNKSLSSYSFVSGGLFLEKRNDINAYKDTVFLKNIIKGKINLYEFTPKDSYKNYYGENDNKILELPPRFFTFKRDTTRGYGYFIQNGIYNRIPNFSATYTEQLSYLDSLTYLMTDDNDFYATRINRQIEPNLEGFAGIIQEYNVKHPEKTNVIASNKKKFGKIYFGFSYGIIKPKYDYRATDNSTIDAVNSSAYSIFALIPAYGTNRNLFYRIGFQKFNYLARVSEPFGLPQEEERSINALSLGLRYSVMKGPFRPYLGGSVTVMKQKIQGYTTATEFPLLFEAGATVPIRKINLFIQANIYPPFNPKIVGFKFSSFSAGIIF